MTEIYPEMVRADLVIWASPLVLGNVSALTKKAQDRFIPLLHPYIRLVDGECHHRKRYERNADIGLIIEPAAHDNEDDCDFVRRAFERYSRNARSRLRLFATSGKPIGEVVDEAITA
jgi:multimeric flavodoxin WrbA